MTSSKPRVWKAAFLCGAFLFCALLMLPIAVHAQDAAREVINDFTATSDVTIEQIPIIDTFEDDIPEEPEIPDMIDMPMVKLRSLDKTTARTMTFKTDVGSTLKFGPIFIKVQSCRQSSPVEEPESAAFLQVWENSPEGEPQWIFSGWMFASSPGLSAMDHPIYEVWVMDCLNHDAPEEVEREAEADTMPENDETAAP
jgi:hypothetical protein